MQIAMVASEVAPFSKEGGLADVLGALPRALAQLGEDVCVISPLYRDVRGNAKKAGMAIEPVPDSDFTVPIGDAQVEGRVWKSLLPGSNVTAYFLQNDRYYDRDGYYTRRGNHTDYQDNSERFIFLSRGALEGCRLRPQAGRLPLPRLAHRPAAHLRQAPLPRRLPARGHRLHHPQPRLPGPVLALGHEPGGLPWRLFTWQMLEYYGNFSFLKAGLVGADVLTDGEQDLQPGDTDGGVRRRHARRAAGAGRRPLRHRARH